MEKTGGFLDKIISVFWNQEENRARAIIRLIILLVVLVFSSIAIALLFTYIFTSGTTDQTSTTQTMSTGAFIFYMIVQVITYISPMFITLWFMAKYIDRRPLKEYGFHFSKKWWTDLASGFVMGGILISVLFLLARAFKLIYFYPSNVNIVFFIPFSIVIIIQAVFYIAVALWEEAIVLGYVMKNIAEGAGFSKYSIRISIIIGWVLTSILFGYLHQGSSVFTWLGLLNITLLGLLMGGGYMLTGDVGLSIGLHFGWNLFLGSVYGFPVSGKMASASLMASYPHAPYTLSGGLFGPEAGLIALFAILLGGALLWGYIKLTRKEVKIIEAIAQYIPLQSVASEVVEEVPAAKKKSAKKK